MRIVQIVAARVIADQIDRVVAAAGVVVAHAQTARRCYRHLGQLGSRGFSGGNRLEMCPVMPPCSKPTWLLTTTWRALVWSGPSERTSLRSGMSGGC
ncbi:hypothetical protein [Candidatus Laterigemmans baculatus]|uniref:hypothetical protein n=1 Tax=Candidatus Laterigemmans baculatus TaxID=2770505 RepID=UPI0013DA07CE|nr:hypothetical protein [Candidatus Laterigemmans baculatus]